MEFEIGDLVTRKSYHDDIVFQIINIEENIVYLKGQNVRLLADSPKEDLNHYDEKKEDTEEETFLERIKPEVVLDRNDYFYLPGKILHVDSDQGYLTRCLKYYEDMNIWAIGVCEKENVVPSRIRDLLEEYNPNIVVITGHDACYKKNGNMKVRILQIR